MVHLAAWPGVPASCADPIGFDAVNSGGAVTIFEAARRAGVERVAYASSCAVYGDTAGRPRAESAPLARPSPYPASKAANELYGRVFTNTLGLDCVGLRYFNVFGPRQDPRGPYAAVIPRFVEFALSGQPLTIFGDGEASRDFVWVGDVACANVDALEAPGAAGAAYNIGSGRAVTVNELATYVLSAISTPSRVAYHPPAPATS